MPDRPTLTLYPKKRRILLMLLACLGFVAIGVWMVQAGKWMGWLTAGFFGLLVPIFLLQLVPGSGYLTIDTEGFEFCSLFRPHRVAWSDVSEFGAFSIHNHHGIAVHKMVGFNYVPDHEKHVRGRQLSRAVCGYEASLPDNYGMQPEELAELLIATRSACLGLGSGRVEGGRVGG